MDVPLRVSGLEIHGQSPQFIKNFAYKNRIDNPDHIKAFSEWLYQRIKSMYVLLQKTGFLALRFDYHYGHYAKIMLDEVFGEKNFVIEFLVRRMKKNLSLVRLRNSLLNTIPKPIMKYSSLMKRSSH